jgi:hypothetical protein
MTDNSNRKGIDEVEEGPDKSDELGIELRASNGIRPSIEPTRFIMRQLVLNPIQKTTRLDPNLKVQEQFVFTWKINLILAGAAVSLGIGEY